MFKNIFKGIFKRTTNFANNLLLLADVNEVESMLHELYDSYNHTTKIVTNTDFPEDYYNDFPCYRIDVPFDRQNQEELEVLCKKIITIQRKCEAIGLEHFVQIVRETGDADSRIFELLVYVVLRRSAYDILIK